VDAVHRARGRRVKVPTNKRLPGWKPYLSEKALTPLAFAIDKLQGSTEFLFDRFVDLNSIRTGKPLPMLPDEEQDAILVFIKAKSQMHYATEALKRVFPSRWQEIVENAK